VLEGLGTLIGLTSRPGFELGMVRPCSPAFASLGRLIGLTNATGI
jgi:hypothetical protein